MTTADGSVIGKTQIFGSAPASHAFNVVLLAEGFTTAQQAHFNTACMSFVQAFLTTPPYDGLSAAINIFRVNVRSTHSVSDDPTSTGGTGATPRTYFDASFGANGIQRLLVCDDMTALTVATAQVPQFSAVLVVVNSTEYGGSGGSVGVYSLADGATEIALHEMGHTAYGLADEYPYYAGGVEPAQNHFSGPEPSEPNITANSVRASLKWRWAVPATTAIPTMHNPDCSTEDYRPSPVPGGTVGLFEGAGYFHCGAYRPEYDCKMRNLGVPFCRVCRQVIWNDIGPLSTPGGFTSLAPYRLLDTRSGQGALRGAVAPRGTVSLQVAGCGGVPASGVAAVALNVTVAEPTASGYVTVYGGGMTRPTASNLNYVAGQVVPNLVVAPVGAGGWAHPGRGRPGRHRVVAGDRPWQSPGLRCLCGGAERDGRQADRLGVRDRLRRGDDPPDGVEPELRGRPGGAEPGCRPGRGRRQSRPVQRLGRNRPAHRRRLGLLPFRRPGSGWCLWAPGPVPVAGYPQRDGRTPRRGRRAWHRVVAGDRPWQRPGLWCLCGGAERDGRRADRPGVRHRLRLRDQPPDRIQPELCEEPVRAEPARGSGRGRRQSRPVQRLPRNRPTHRRRLGVLPCRLRIELRDDQ